MTNPPLPPKSYSAMLPSVPIPRRGPKSVLSIPLQPSPRAHTHTHSALHSARGKSWPWPWASAAQVFRPFNTRLVGPPCAKRTHRPLKAAGGLWLSRGAQRTTEVVSKDEQESGEWEGLVAERRDSHCLSKGPRHSGVTLTHLHTGHTCLPL